MADPEKDRDPVAEDLASAAAEAGRDDAVVSEAAPAADGDASVAAADALPTREEILQRERDEAQDRCLRLLAELDNLRKRTRREAEDARRFALAGLIRPLLGVYDNFERALAAAADAGGDDATLTALRTGVELIAQSFRQTLLDQGVREIAAEGRDFDPAVHEAVGAQPAPAGAASGAVVAVVQKGYQLDDLVLRPARVIVAQ